MGYVWRFASTLVRAYGIARIARISNDGDDVLVGLDRNLQFYAIGQQITIVIVLDLTTIVPAARSPNR